MVTDHSSAGPVEPRRQSTQEIRAYRLLVFVLTDLWTAERVLADAQYSAPDGERACHLAAIRAAIAALRTVASPLVDS